mmetsp:Transcript_23257/g.56111  ORF Transcript_23257/g.56111 Transcript_23257/m.56111 type:complete len:413 (+) Transcript_23257:193-1431(+)|eukprot:CAMPEP_0181140104 /NCGR_PEP_ID=MMETSP1071-20121207/35131_1 /TAXON_ID=35127 /ORGANISM="Thalassiosira sp., Strain NH16" /LENGTH=412 /DNA_ID=CAMNT_0023227043 /DNA_START=154 /DNA_END=1395 /DNA_ORIENTATION=-
MNPILCKATIVAAAAISSTDAFVTNSPMTTSLPTTRAAANFVNAIVHNNPLLASHHHHHHHNHRSTTSTATSLYNTQDDDAQDNEIERLKKMAAKLRAEAASLEADKAKQLADAAERAFNRFDANSDGEVSLGELKLGLEKELKTEISEKRVKELMDVFDTSGDGALQLDEFVTVDRFRNQLEALAREEKRLASEAEQESKRQEQEALLAQAKLEFLNEKEPTTSDKIVSVLPYLFPLMDGLQYGRFLLGAEDAGANPLVVILALLYALYRSIPFSGFVAFFALNFLAGNPSINRLVRFNMQQAIFVDIALFFPSLLIGLGGLISKSVGSPISPLAGEIFSDVMFGTLLLTLAYCAGSSLLGREPDGIPFISSAVKERMPTIDMFDDEGRYVPTESRRDGDDDSEKSDKDKK